MGVGVIVLQVHTLDEGGGAAKVARALAAGLRSRGHPSWLLVGRKHTSDPDILQLQHHQSTSGWGRWWWYLHDLAVPFAGRVKGFGRLSRALGTVAVPSKAVARFRGIEDFAFPGSHRLLDQAPEVPNLVHLHNLHGGYFDLAALPGLSHRIPTVVTLHDSWMFTGHCAQPLDCNGWQHGCGSCPYLDTYPSVRRDATDRNWLRKKEIYEESFLFVAAPSRWLLDRAEQSILAGGIADTRLIPNGVDLSIFRPADAAAARASVGIPVEGSVLLFSGFAPSSSSYKDLATLRGAVHTLGVDRGKEPITLVALGEEGETERIGRASIHFIAYEPNEPRVAAFYQAADLYVHAAREGGENHSLSVLEALASGVPVVATSVGGIPEQVKSHPVTWSQRVNPSSATASTGILTPPGDSKTLADAIAFVLKNESLRRSMSLNASADARERFDLERQVDSYLDWYLEIIDRFRKRPNASPQTPG